MSSHHLSGRRLVGVFEREGDLLAAVRHLRREGLPITDVQTPYAVHGLDEAAGLERSRLGWVCGVAGLSAAAGMLAFETWVSVMDWPINVGGKPFASIPAFIPVVFEVGVLTAGLTTVLAFLVVSGLFPGKKASTLHPGVTDDRFVIVVEAPGAGPERERAAALCRQHGAVEVEERLAEGGGR